MRITKNFTLEELTKSSTALRYGLNNKPGFEETCNLFHLTFAILQPLRDLVKMPVTVNSGYRSEHVNKRVKGAKNSQHMLGQAADIEVAGIDNADLYRIIKDHFVFDQLILEFYTPGIPDSGWVHVSYVDGENRMQAFKIS